MEERRKLDLNLLRPMRIAGDAQRAPFYKALVLDFGTVAAAFGSSYTYVRYLEGGLGIAWPLGIFLVFGISTALHPFLTRGMTRRVITIAAEVVALAAGATGAWSQYAWWGFAVAFALLLWGEIQSRQALANGLELKFLRVSRPVVKKFVTIAALLATLLYLPRVDASGEFVSRDAFRNIFGWTAALAREWQPEITLNSTFERFAESVVESELRENSRFAELSVAAKAGAVAAAVREFTARMTATLRIEASPTEPLEDVLYRALTAAISRARDAYGTSFLAGWGIALFLVLRGLGVLFQLAITVLSLAAFELLLAFRITHLVLESRPKEMVEFS